MTAVNESLHAAVVRLPLSHTACALFDCTGAVEPMLARFQAVLMALLFADLLLLGAAAAALGRCWRQRRRTGSGASPDKKPPVPPVRLVELAVSSDVELNAAL